ncbi:MAG: family efflux transporter permease subunit [Flavipsychrobacter sp.]|nr:family efflux transporter permease subunit [Flavipsychrobacter sp.]
MATVALGSREGKWIMASAITASSMAFIDGTALNVVLPSLQQGLNATGADIFWILNAYLLMLASLILIGGSLGDKLGRKKMFMLGIFIFILGSGLCGTAGNVFFLIVFRVIQGIGGALMIPGSLSLISSSIDEKERGKAIGTWSAVTTAVTIGGPVLGGALGDAGLWRYIFFINIPIGVVALIILSGKVKEIKDEDSDKAIDIKGALAIASSLALLTFGFLRIPEYGFNNWQVYCSFVAGLLLLCTFVWIEQNSKHPMMPLQLFKVTAFTGANLLTFFLYAGLGAGMLFLSLNLVQVQGYSQLESGLTFLPFTLLMVTFARYAGKQADKHGPRLFLIAGPFVAGLGLLALAFIKQTNGPGAYWTTFFPGICLFGLGMSFTVAPLTATVMGAVSDHYSGTASGVNNAVTRISGVLANAIFGALAVLLFTASLSKELGNSSFAAQDKKSILAEAANLGNANVPAGIAADSNAVVIQYYHHGFIDAYMKIMLMSAGLCFVGALMSALFIRNTAIKTSHPNT